MHDESGLLVGHLERVIDGTGHRTGHHAAQGTGGEHHQTQQPGEDVRAALGLDQTFALDDHLHKAFDAAGLLCQIDDGCGHQHGANDDGIAGGHRLGNVIHAGVDTGKEAARQDHAAGQNADEQGDEYVFGHQRQNDRQQRRDHGPEAQFHRDSSSVFIGRESPFHTQDLQSRSPSRQFLRQSAHNLRPWARSWGFQSLRRPSTRLG